MKLASLLLLGGIGFLGAKAISGKSSSSSTSGAKTGGAGGLVTCTDAAKDCAALMACAGPILAKATAADTLTLSKMLSKATALGCTDVVTQINKKLSDLGLGGVDVKTTDPTTSDYSIVHNVGTVSSVGDGDMMVVCLTNKAKDQKYLTTLIFSNPADPTGTFEKALAEIALTKFKAEVAKSGVDPTFILGPFFLMGAPSDLKDGATFPITLGSSFAMGDVIAVVTSAQMKSGLVTTKTSSAAFKSFVGGEDDVVTARRVFGRNGFNGNFGSKSRFGTASIGG